MLFTYERRVQVASTRVVWSSGCLVVTAQDVHGAAEQPGAEELGGCGVSVSEATGIVG